MNKKNVIGILALLCLCTATLSAQKRSVEERLAELEQNQQNQKKWQKYLPQLHGVLRGKYEYEPELKSSRFEVRNARLSVESSLPTSSKEGAKLFLAYKLEIDLCDESQIKMKDAWVRLGLNLGGRGGGQLRASIGQQRLPFSIDAHRNPSAQYFANRSFIAKQIGDVRDVGFLFGYSPVLPSSNGGKTEIHLDAGVFNGSNLENEKSAWFKSISYSARAQFIYHFPRKGKIGVVPSVQHRKVADRMASYTQVDFGAYYERSFQQGGAFRLEAEYLRKFYTRNVFDDCNAVNAMAIYRHPLHLKDVWGETALSILLRYDYMGNHSDGKAPLLIPPTGGEPKLQQSDAERHRLTAGITFHLGNKYLPADLRLNYEKYWYPHNGTPKESEQDKVVAELMIRF